MDIKITFRHMEHSAPLEEHARQQLKKVITFLQHEREPIYIELVLEPSKVREHSRIELLVKTPHYDRVSSHEYTGDTFYKALDHVIDVMYHELHEDKRKELDMRKMRGRHDDFKKQR